MLFFVNSRCVLVLGVVTPSVLVVTAVLFIPAAVFIGYVLYKCYNRQVIKIVLLL